MPSMTVAPTAALPDARRMVLVPASKRATDQQVLRRFRIARTTLEGRVERPSPGPA